MRSSRESVREVRQKRIHTLRKAGKTVQANFLEKINEPTNLKKLSLKKVSPKKTSSVHSNKTKNCNKCKNKCQCKIKINQKTFTHCDGSSRSLVIDKPGYYVFCSDVDVSYFDDDVAAITISSSHVVLDFKHHYLNLTNTSKDPNNFLRTYGVRVTRGLNDVTITGDSEALGKVRNFSFKGVWVEGDTSDINISNLLITSDTQNPGVFSSETFLWWNSVGLSVSDTEDFVVTDRITKNLSIDNVTCTNQVIGGVVSYAENVQIQNSKFNTNCFSGLWLGWDAQITVVTGAEPTADQIRQWIKNIYVDNVEGCDNGFIAPAPIIPPYFGYTGVVDTSLGIETNRIYSGKFYNVRANRNFHDIPESFDNGVFLYGLLRYTQKGFDDDACEAMVFENCQFNENRTVSGIENYVSTCEGFHLSGSIGDLKSNKGWVFRNCQFNGNHATGFVDGVTGLTTVYAQSMVLENCDSSENYVEAEDTPLPTFVDGYYFEGYQSDPPQTNQGFVFRNCVASRNRNNVGVCDGFYISNGVGQPGNLNISRGYRFENCTATQNISTYQGASGNGYHVLGRKGLVYQVSTDEPGLGPFVAIKTQDGPEIVVSTTAVGEETDPSGACQPVADLTGKIGVIDFAACSLYSGGRVDYVDEAGAVGVIIVSNDNGLGAYGGSTFADIPQVAIGSSDGQVLLDALAINPNIQLTIEPPVGVSDDFTSDVLFQNCAAINNGNVEGRDVSAGFRVEGEVGASSCSKIVSENCVALSNIGHGWLNSLSKDCIVKFSEADNNDISGFTDLDDESTGVYAGNVAVKNPVGYNVNYTGGPLQVSPGTADALPGPLVGVLDKLVNVDIQ